MAPTTDPQLPIIEEVGHLQDIKPAAHPQAAEIIRQVEFYLSDENLPHDAHLLGLFKEGKGSVSFNEICGFKKMRRFKPKSAVREALRQSTLVQVSEDGKRLMRRIPLTKRPIVMPKVDEKRKKVALPDDKPWLTKGMMKSTGWEEYATDGPIAPQEYEEDREAYHPDNSFISRIETAITRFCARRTMHEKPRKIFDRFMIFGGMDGGQRMFVGGLDEKSMEDYTKKELAALTAYYGVSERVMDGFVEESTDEPGTWIVDFEATAKGFLSSEFVESFDWYDAELVMTATNILRKFYNYLLLHDVCPEYRDQLVAARLVCDQADEELPKLKEVDCRFPGGFNVACSTLFGGAYADVHVSSSDWAPNDCALGWSKLDAERVFKAGVFAHGTEEQLCMVEEATETGRKFKVISSQEIGLEITSIESPSEEALSIYNSTQLHNTIVRPMGKLKCKRWEVPHAAPKDLPVHVVQAAQQQEFEFLVDEETLEFCVPGMKIECCVKELDLGIAWIDHVEATYATFFTSLVNERIRSWKEPGSPKGWMLRQKGFEAGDERGESLEEEEGDGDLD